MKIFILTFIMFLLIGCSRENPNTQDATAAVEQAASQAAEQQQRRSEALKPNFTKQSKTNVTGELGK